MTGPTTCHSQPPDLLRLRSAALEQLLRFLTPDDRAAADRSGTELQALLAGAEAGREGVVLVGYGGGKDSSYTLAFVRAMQLIQQQRHSRSFVLRAATNWHAGMPTAVMENIGRAYRALGMDRDPDCELLLIEGGAVHPFRSDAPRSRRVTAQNRTDILMTGHRTQADGRPTFCNACNLSVAHSFGVAAAHGTGADIIITGDSAEEQRQYTAWISRLARQVPRGRSHLPTDGFPQVLEALDDVARAYFRDIHGPHTERERAEAGHSVHSDVPRRLRFLSIYAETTYDAGSHWDLLTKHLGFVFDELAFNFTESDCANPALMAHLRGLKCQYLFGRDYREGLREYADFALRLMVRKHFPRHLIHQMAGRYAADDAHVRLRARVNSFAHEVYGLDERQLICMVHSPFTAEGAGLTRYLTSQAPQLARHERGIRRLLAHAGSGNDTAARALAAELKHLSGLDLPQLRTLYASDLRPALMQSILGGDPHKERIRTRHAPDGPDVTETLSGR
ncbi:PqqD family protein [Streptomyces sp. NPDC020607]|uniref:PqqD family protein n=1 Tax=Streptomyces sp. NPDC020607 TaxID=3365082 RepID=UPI0037A92EFC